jgi:glycerol-3-phosphate acyltransferase PlsX
MFMIKIAIDAMGSDKGSSIVVAAVKKFVAEYNDVELHVVGKKEELTEIESMAKVIDAREVMEMEDGALEVMRRKDTSMIMAIDLALNGANAVVSAGGTAALLTGATVKLKLIDNVQRAALCAPFPTENGRTVAILDIGANNENTPEHLVQFAKMGSIFSKRVSNVDPHDDCGCEIDDKYCLCYTTKEPRLYLLSNGSEDKKGSPVSKKAFELLKLEKKLNFKGNVEARLVLSGKADVVVADGYAGNVLLKAIEGTASMMNKQIKAAFKKNLLTKLGYLLAKKGFDEMRQNLDYKKHGGAMLLGINGIVVKAHGSSDDYAFFNAIRVAYEMAKLDVVKLIKDEMMNG